MTLLLAVQLDMDTQQRCVCGGEGGCVGGCGCGRSEGVWVCGRVSVWVGGGGGGGGGGCSPCSWIWTRNRGVCVWGGRVCGRVSVRGCVCVWALAVQLDMDTEQRCVCVGREGVWEGECAWVCVCVGARRAAGYGHGTEVCVWGEGGCVGGCGCVRSEGECACYDPRPRRAAGYGDRTEVCVGGGRVCRGRVCGESGGGCVGVGV